MNKPSFVAFPNSPIEEKSSENTLKFNMSEECGSMQTKASAYDVSRYILGKLGRISTLKLQKLLYYSKAWSLVWDGYPLFTNRIEAWINGPVVVDVFYAHQGKYSVDENDFNDANIDNLTQEQKASIDAVLDAYGDMNGSDIAALTHNESPWINSRKGLEALERGNREITDEAMFAYFGSF